MPLDNDFFVGTAGGSASPTVLGQARQTTAGGPYMAKLGDYMFSLDTSAFQSLQRDTGYRWQTIKRISRAPAAQFTGKDDETIELSGVIYPHFRGGLGQIGLMRAAADRGEPLPLVYGFERLGQYCGLWCIRNIREGRTDFFRDGTPRKIEFSLSLVAYGEDAGSGSSVFGSSAFSAIAALTSGSVSALAESALAVSSTPLITVDSPVDDVRAAAAAVVQAGTAASSAASVAGETAKRVEPLAALNPVLAATGSVIRSAKDIAKVAGSVQLSVKQIQSAVKVVQNSPTDVLKMAQSLRTILSEAQSSADVAGGVIKSYAAKASEDGPTSGVDDKDRLSAAATARNVDRSVESMKSTLGEVERQLTTLTRKFNV